MASNNYNDMTDQQLVDFIAHAATTFTGEGDPAAYGLTAAQVAALSTAGTALGTSVTNAIASEAAFRADIQTKLSARETALANVGVCAGLMYATPGVTDAMVAAAGFQPRDTERTPIFPSEPLNLVANPNANGTVHLFWSRNGNPYGVEFVIEESSDGVNWGVANVTKRKSLTLDGYAPGVQKWFRVKATNRGVSSVFSNSVSIYAPGEGVQLQLAA